MSFSLRAARRLLIWTIVLGGIVAAGVVAARPFIGAKEARPNFEIVRAVRRDVGRSIKATGVIKPAIGAEIRVGSRVSGVVSRLHVRVGDTVKQHDLLAELEARELVSRRDDAAAALRVAEANVAFETSELARKRQLNAERLIAPTELESAVRAADVAAEQLSQARATLDFADTQLGYTRIFSPMSGVVSSVSTQEGETVAASFAAPTFLTLLDLDRLEVRAYVDETDIGRVARGQAATFTVDTYDDEAFEGQVATIYPQAEIRDNVVNYVAVIRFARPKHRTLRPEMTTTVTMPLDLRRQVVAVPLRAVRAAGGAAYVLVGRGQEVVRQAVRLGGRDDSYYEVLEGLNDGDEVIVGDVEGVGDGHD